MKRTNRSIHLLAIVGVALVATACDDTTAPEDFEDEMVLDAAILAADAVLEEVNMWGQPFGFGPTPVAGHEPGLFRDGRPGGHGNWSGEFSGTRSVTFYDDQGVEQDAYDALTTESINIVREISGSISRDNFSAEIERARDMTVSGLTGEETHRTWNGAGESNVARSGVLEDGTERSHSAEGSVEFADVVVPIPGSENRYPISGTITRMMTVTRTGPDGTTTREVVIVVTFDGSSTATALVNGEEMEIDLSAREGRNPLRRRPS